MVPGAHTADPNIAGPITIIKEVPPLRGSSDDVPESVEDTSYYIGELLTGFSMTKAH